jgi:hypothetical protein
MNDRLNSIFENTIYISKPNWIEAVRKQKVPLQQLLFGGHYHYFNFTMYHMFITKKEIKFKQSLYTMGRLLLLDINKYEARILDFGIGNLLFSLFSDSSKLRRQFSLATNNHHEQVKYSLACSSYSIQCVIKDDWDEVKKCLETFRKNKGRKGSGYKLEGYLLRFIEALKAKDEASMLALFNELELPKNRNRRKDKGSIMWDYLSFPTAGLVKLAWIKGMEIHVDSPLVPMEWMPIKPLDNYEDEFEFLKELDEEIIIEKRKEIFVDDEYKTENPNLINEWINPHQVNIYIEKLVPNYSKAEKLALGNLIWNAYTNPLAFDDDYLDFARSTLGNGGSINKDGVLERPRKPFLSEWSAMKKDEHYFLFVLDFILNEKLGTDPEIENIIQDLEDKLDG